MLDLPFHATPSDRNAPSERRGFKLFLRMKKDPLNFFTRLMNEAGDYAWMNINGHPIVMLNDATGIEHVLSGKADNYFKGYFQRSMKPLFGESILLQEGEVWRQRRHMAAPVFASGNFEEITRQMVLALESMFKKWDADIATGKLIDVTIEMTHFTLDALLRSLFHEMRDDIAGTMRSSLGIMLRDVEKRLWSAIQVPKVISYNLPKYRAARKFMKEIVNELITVRRAGQNYPEDLLSRFVNGFATTSVQQKALYDEVLSYVLAGHETTAHGLAWALFTLSKYPLIQQKVEREVKEVLGDKTPGMDDLKKLTYTRQFFDEVMRLFPPVWTMSREAISDDQIPLDDGSHLNVKAGDSIMMCHYAVHRREKYWPQPEAFDPERFSSEAMKKRPKFAWFPFGGGPRLCLGIRFAQYESILALAMISQRYDFSLVSGQHVVPEPIITLRPKDSILFKMQQKRSDAKENLCHQARAIDHAPKNTESDRISKCPFH